MIRLGNDVVDLRDSRCRGKADDERFLARIFADPEVEAIRSAPAPNRALWIRWAAKEAAFKVVTRLLGAPPTFEHAAFRVRIQEEARSSSGPLRGRVIYRGTEVPFRADPAPDRVHVLAWHPPGGAGEVTIQKQVKVFPDLAHEAPADWDKNLRPRFTDREWRSVHGPPSALARLKARADVARVLGLGESEVEIVCQEGPPGRMPPRLIVQGEDYPGDITLSHHGRFLAWAFVVLENE